MAIDPFLAATLLNVGGGLLGGALLGDGPDVPDFVGEQAGANRAASRRLRRRLARGNDQLTEDLAAAGVTGAARGGAMGRFYDGAMAAEADLADAAADDLAAARNRQRAAQFAADSQRHANRAGALGEVLRSVSTYGAMKGMEQQALNDAVTRPVTPPTPVGGDYGTSGLLAAAAPNVPVAPQPFVVPRVPVRTAPTYGEWIDPNDRMAAVLRSIYGARRTA